MPNLQWECIDAKCRQGAQRRARPFGGQTAGDSQPYPDSQCTPCQTTDAGHAGAPILGPWSN